MLPGHSAERVDTLTEAEILDFIRAQIGSVYTLELLILLKRSHGRAWRQDELIRELRSSPTAVADGLARLTRVGLVNEGAESGYAFAPASPELGELAAAVEELYTIRPITVVKAIMSAPVDKLRAFSDAFKLKE
jgi:hypothetical protein